MLAAAALGWPHERIAAHMGIDAKTLRKYYRDVLDSAADDIDLGVFTSLIETGRGRPAQLDEAGRVIRAELPPNPSILIFLAKTRLGFSELRRVETHIGGIEGAPPVPINTTGGQVTIYLPHNDRDELPAGTGDEPPPE